MTAAVVVKTQFYIYWLIERIFFWFYYWQHFIFFRVSCSVVGATWIVCTLSLGWVPEGFDASLICFCDTIWWISKSEENRNDELGERDYHYRKKVLSITSCEKQTCLG